MKNLFIRVLAVALVLSIGVAFAASPASKATKVAKAWLKLVDEGKYARSWDETTEYFKKTVKKEQWERQLTAVRSPLGKALSRKLISKQFRTSLPGVPDGEYAVMIFKTSFEKKKSATEVIVPMLVNDRTWFVSGYYIK